MRSQQIITLLLGLGWPAYAGVQKICPNGNLCYSLNIPDSSASSGSGDIFLQISAPTSYSWAGFGQGSQMAGAQVFVIYTDSSGTNVTLSPRLATGEIMPQYNSKAEVTLLEGSGVSSGVMTANIRCSSCSSWSGGKMDFSSSTTDWIFAAHSGSELNSDSPSYTISQHQKTYGTISFDSSAKGGSDLNPFLSTDSSSTSSATSSASSSSSTGCGSSSSTTGTSTSNGGTSETSGNNGSNGWLSWIFGFPNGPSRGSPSSFPSDAPYSRRSNDGSCPNDNGSNGNGQNFRQSASEIQRQQMILTAHGVMAALAMVALFPLGAIAVRLMSFSGVVWFHAACQGLAFILFLIAFGLGIYMANDRELLRAYHPIIGIIIFVLLCLQLPLGFLHHSQFKKYQARTFWTYGHLWNGRIIITFGIINGGLGLHWVANTNKGLIIYGVIAGAIYILYLVSIIVGESRRRRVVERPKIRASTPAYGGQRRSRTLESSQPKGSYGETNFH